MAQPNLSCAIALYRRALFFRAPPPAGRTIIHVYLLAWVHE